MGSLSSTYVSRIFLYEGSCLFFLHAEILFFPLWGPSIENLVFRM